MGVRIKKCRCTNKNFRYTNSIRLNLIDKIRPPKSNSEPIRLAEATNLIVIRFIINSSEPIREA
jgi:hypothetical protein